MVTLGPAPAADAAKAPRLPRLEARALYLVRGERRLFKDLGFTLDAGGLILLRGPNGAGKSSLLRVLAGLLPATGGTVGWTPAPAPRIRYLGHRDGLKSSLSVAENLRFLAAIDGTDLSATTAALRLDRLMGSPVSDLSAGQRRRVAMARLVAGDGSLWLLDEPTTALDAAARDWMWQAVAAHRAAGGGVIAAVHDPDAPADAAVLTLGAPS